MRSAILWLGLAACGGGTASTIGNQAAPIVAGKATPCPEDKALTALVQKAWGAGAEVKTCVAHVRSGKTLWWLEGAADPPPDTMHEVPIWNAIVDEGRQVVWSGKPELGLGFGYEYMGRTEAADLDGDGNDEVLYERTTGEGGVSMSELVVVYFEPAPVILGVPISSMGWTEGGEQESCNGTWTLAPGAAKSKRIAVERTGKCDPDSRRETFERRGKSFEQVSGG